MCNCINCQTRLRWNTHYQKYLETTGDKANIKWIAKMMKTDKEILFCLKSKKGKQLKEWAYHNE